MLVRSSVGPDCGGGLRFLQTDPIPGGSANAYDYVGQDPINDTDLNGQWGWHSFTHFLKKHWKAAVHIAIGIAVRAAAVAGAAALCAGTAGVGCVVVAGALFTLGANTAAQLSAASLLHERVTGRNLLAWTADGFLGGARNGYMVGRWGKGPAGLALRWLRRRFF
jgi:hypothetical protein